MRKHIWLRINAYPFDTSMIEDKAIFCSQHNISFDLESGQISNRPYEHADPIQIFPLVEQNDQIGVTLDEWSSVAEYTAIYR